MPIHLLALFLLFIMSNLFDRGGGGGAGSNLSVLKEAKTNYMGRFIFSRGGGGGVWGPFAYSFFFIFCLFLKKKKKKTFCGFPWVETSTAGRVYDLCVYYMTGAPEGSPKVVLCGFMFLWRSRESNLRPLVYKA